MTAILLCYRKPVLYIQRQYVLNKAHFTLTEHLIMKQGRNTVADYNNTVILGYYNIALFRT